MTKPGRPGARKATSKKGATKGTGGLGRKALEGKTELDAVIAYLQGLGTALKSGKAAAPAPTAEAAPAPATNSGS